MENNNGCTSLPGGNSERSESLRKVTAALDELRDTVIRNFDQGIWFNLKACLSVIATLMLKDARNPVGLLLITAPSSGKTTVLSMLYGLPMVYRSDGFTPAALVSHACNIKKEERLRQIDMLPKIKGKCLVVKDMSTIFSQDKDQLQKSLGALTNVFDGEGYVTDSGSHGQRGYSEDTHFAMLAATPPIPNRVWQLMSRIGSRLLMLTADDDLDPAERMAKSFSDVFDPDNKAYVERVQECKDAVAKYFEVLLEAYCPEGFARSIEWNFKVDSIHLKNMINIMANFASRARSGVFVKRSNGNSADDFEDYTQPQIEYPQRLAALLYEVARGSAIISGRQQIGMDDISVVVEIALSSMHNSRRQVINLILQSPGPKKTSERGTVTSTEIHDALTMSRPIALRIIKEFELLQLGSTVRFASNGPITFTLQDTYKWLLSDEFAALRRPWEKAD